MPDDLRETAAILAEKAQRKVEWDAALANIQEAVRVISADPVKYHEDVAALDKTRADLRRHITEGPTHAETWGTTESRTKAADDFIKMLKGGKTAVDPFDVQGAPKDDSPGVGYRILGALQGALQGKMGMSGAMEAINRARGGAGESKFTKAFRPESMLAMPKAAVEEGVAAADVEDEYASFMGPHGSFNREVFGDPLVWLPILGQLGKVAAGTRAGVTAAVKTRPLVNAIGKPLKVAGMKADDVLAATGRVADKAGRRVKDAVKLPPGESGAAINPAPYILKGGKRATEAYKAFRDYGRSVWTDKVFGNIERYIWQEAPEIIGEALGTTLPSTMREVLKEGFGSLRARVGEAVYAGMMEVRAALPTAEADTLQIGKTLANLTDDQARDAVRYMRPRVVGEKPVRPTWASDDQLATLDEWKSLIMNEVDESVRLGRIRPDTREEYVNGYLFRQFENPEFRQVFRGRKGPTNPLHYSKDAYGAVVKMESEDAARTLMKAAGDESLLSAEKVGSEGQRVLVKFKDKASQQEFMRRYHQAYGKGKVYDKFDPLPEDRLAELGEVIDPHANVYNTLKRLRQDNAKLRLYEAIDGQGFAMAGADAPASWKAIPDSPRWGALRGKSVRPDIYRELTAVDKTLMTTKNRIWQSMLAKWKAGKTVMSARTHARNFMGNGPFSVLADNTAPWFGGLANWRYYRGAHRSIRSRDAMWREMIEQGIIGTQYADEELKILGQFFDDAAASGPEALGNKLANFFAKEWTGPVGRKAAKLYNYEDAIYRAAAYVKARKAWGWDASKATQHVDRFFPNYANVGQVVKGLSMHPMGAPFSRFQNEAIRILYNGIKYRPIKTAAMFYAGTEGIGEIAKATTGMSDAEYKGIRSRGPMALPMFWRNEDGNVETLATDYIFPWGSSLSGLLGTQYNQDEDVKRWLEIVGPMIGQNPAFTSLAGSITGVDPFTGRDIVRPGQRGAPAKARFIAENLAPGITPVLGREGRKVEDMLRGRPFASGEERTPARTVLDVLTGLNPRPYDPKNEREKWFRRMGGIKHTAGREQRWFERTRKTQEKAGYEGAKEEAAEGIENVRQIRGEKYLAAWKMFRVTSIIKYENMLKEETDPRRKAQHKRTIKMHRDKLKELEEKEERGEGVLPVR